MDNNLIHGGTEKEREDHIPSLVVTDHRFPHEETIVLKYLLCTTKPSRLEIYRIATHLAASLLRAGERLAVYAPMPTKAA